MAYADLKTKRARVIFMKEQLASNDRWMLKGLVTIYNRQTEGERQSEVTQEHNKVGFTGIDGTILTSFAKQFIKKGGLAALSVGVTEAEAFFSKKQLPILRRKMPKYARQLVEISDSKTR